MFPVSLLGLGLIAGEVDVRPSPLVAAFNGLTSSGEFNASVKSTDQYATFTNQMQKTVSCRGGDPSIAGKIISAPNNDTVFQTFQAWEATARTLPDIMSFSVLEIWVLMSISNNTLVASYADDVQNAFVWMVQNPQPHRTPVRMYIESDWGEFGLLTPSAYVDAATVVVSPPEDPGLNNTIATQTKVQWGKEHSHAYRRTTVE